MLGFDQNLQLHEKRYTFDFAIVNLITLFSALHSKMYVNHKSMVSFLFQKYIRYFRSFSCDLEFLLRRNLLKLRLSEIE